MQFDREKLKSAVLYAAATCPKEVLGAVKLHKIFYFTDMMEYADSGSPMFGATYRKRPNGPTCEQLFSVVDELRSEGELVVETVDFHGYEKRQFISKTKPSMERFNANETELLDDIIDFVCNSHTAKTISDFSHQLPWDLVEFGDIIDYNSVFLLFPEEMDQESLDWAKKEATLIETARSKQDAVDYTDGATFRSRVLEACGG